MRRRTSRRTPRARQRVAVGAAALAVAVGAVLAGGGPTPADAAGGSPHGHRHAAQSRTVGTDDALRAPVARGVYGAQPLVSFRSFADPSVTPWSGGYIATATGPGALRAAAPTPEGPWTDAGPALLTLPSWAIANRAWASDITKIKGTYLLYFSVQVAGLPDQGRCIGVATSPDPSQPFLPQDRPVVCPKAAVAPAAYDRLKHHPRDIPINGVIDPDVFKDKRGHYYLLYRTQAFPASIRIVPLPRDGLPEGTTVRSQELVRSTNAIENPTILKRKGEYLLFTSENDFTGCDYVTTWRRSDNLFDWSKSGPKILLDSAKTGLCGPGGADAGGGRKNFPVLFFHAWTCPDLGNIPCPAGPNYDASHTYHAIRSMYGVTLRFTKHQAPRIAGYLTPAPAG